MFITNVHLRSVTLELMLNSETTAVAAALCQPCLQQYFSYVYIFSELMYSYLTKFEKAEGLSKIVNTCKPKSFSNMLIPAFLLLTCRTVH